MILDIFAFRNKKMKAFTNPWFSQDKLENMEVNLSRSIILGGPDMVAKYKNLVLYHFGTFDDEKGKYILLDEPELVCDCDDIIAQLPEA